MKFTIKVSNALTILLALLMFSIFAGLFVVADGILGSNTPTVNSPAVSTHLTTDAAGDKGLYLDTGDSFIIDSTLGSLFVCTATESATVSPGCTFGKNIENNTNVTNSSVKFVFKTSSSSSWVWGKDQIIIDDGGVGGDDDTIADRNGGENGAGQVKIWSMARYRQEDSTAGSVDGSVIFYATQADDVDNVGLSLNGETDTLQSFGFNTNTFTASGSDNAVKIVNQDNTAGRTATIATDIGSSSATSLIRSTLANTGTGASDFSIQVKGAGGTTFTLLGYNAGTDQITLGNGKNVILAGKLTAGAVDPPYVSFSSETHETIRNTWAPDVSDHEEVMTFWNTEAQRMEVYVIAEDAFYTFDGVLVG